MADPAIQRDAMEESGSVALLAQPDVVHALNSDQNEQMEAKESCCRCDYGMDLEDKFSPAWKPFGPRSQTLKAFSCEHFCHFNCILRNVSCPVANCNRSYTRVLHKYTNSVYLTEWTETGLNLVLEPDLKF